MPDRYSDLLSADRDRLTKSYTPPVSTSRYRYRRARINLRNAGFLDRVHLMVFKPTDRITDIEATVIADFGAGGASTAFGFWKNQGPLVNAENLDNQFFGLTDLDTTATRIDAWKGTNSKVTDIDRSEPIWKLLDDFGLPNFYGNPPDHVIVLSALIAAPVGDFSLDLSVEVKYISGD